MISKYIQTNSLVNKVVLLTGASQGIGLETAKLLSLMGAKLILTSRKEPPSIDFSQLQANTKHQVYEPVWLPLELCSFNSVKSLYNKVQATPIDIVIHNAGSMIKEKTITEEGYESTLQMHYLSPVLLNLLFLKQQKQPMKFLHLTSGLIKGQKLKEDEEYHFWNAYIQAKLSHFLFSNYLDRVNKTRPSSSSLTNLLSDHSIQTAAVDPGEQNGFTTQEIESKMGKASTNTLKAAEQVAFACSLADSGVMVMREKVMPQSVYQNGYDEKIQEQLWKKTFDLLQNHLK